MRLSELAGKEVINLEDGGRLGIIDDCELVFECRTGRIDSLLLPNRSRLFSFLDDSHGSIVPWHCIKRIGDEVIIVDLSNSLGRMPAPIRQHFDED